MPRSVLRGLILAPSTALMLVLAACGGQSPSLDPSPSAGVQGIDYGRAAQDQCPSVDLRLPDGTAVDLNGTWVGVGEREARSWPGTYELNLLQSCLAWVGRSTEEGEQVGASWMNVLFGKVNPDFTISGDWAVVFASAGYCPAIGSGALCTRARGTLILRIESVEGGRVRLVLHEYTKVGGGGGIGGFVTGIWVRPGDEDLLDVPVD